MTWKNDMNRQLDALAAGGSPGDVVAVATDVGELRCAIESVNAIGCAFMELSLEVDRLAAAKLDELKDISDRLSKRLTYLLEPISPIEIDADGATVQMRSNPPQKDDDGTCYYELLVRRHGLCLVRYRKPAGNPRQRIVANVTREVLGRLAEDFVAAV